MEKNILVTGSRGFIGRNLLDALRRREDVRVDTFDSDDPAEELASKLADVDVVYHLAGVNRTDDTNNFGRVNRDLTRAIAEQLVTQQSKALVVFSSSTQAELDNDYGQSKQAGEQALLDASERGLHVCLYRLPGVFGKWSRPNYNTVVATFCHRVARGMKITLHDRTSQLTLVYIDEVVKRFLSHLDQAPAQDDKWGTLNQTFHLTLGQLADQILTIHDIRTTCKIPDLSNDFTRHLYSTYLSFLPKDDFSYAANLKTDQRGWLFELVKSESFGQIFVSTTHPGVTRGNHYHDSKIEKFCVVQGRGLIRFRHVESSDVIEYPVDEGNLQIVDIPPGYTHSIENTGDKDMVTLFWANEVFNPDAPDTYWEEVLL